MWAFCYMLWQMATTEAQALIWTKGLMMAVAIAPVTNYHAILTLFQAETPARKKFLVFLYVVAFSIFLSGFTNHLVTGVIPKLNFPFWPEPGLFTHIFFLTIPIPIIGAIYLVLERKNKAAPLEQNQLKWYIFSVAVGYGGGSSNLFLWYNIPIPPYFTVLSTLLVPVSALIYFRLGLLDFSFFFKKSAVYATSAVLIGILFCLATLPFTSNWKLLFPILTLSLIYPVAYKFLTQIMKTLFTTLPQETIHGQIEKIKETTYTYDDLARNIVNSMLNTFPIEMAAVYLYDFTKRELHLRSQKGMRNPQAQNLRYNRSALAIPSTDPLIQFLGSERNVVSLDSLKNKLNTDKKIYPVIESMNRIESDVCAPFIFEGNLRGMMVISRKKDNSLFNAEDLEAIAAFARMGEEIMRYIMGMETELRNTSLYSHDMAHDVRSIIQTLEFATSPMAEKQPKEKIQRLLHQANEVAMRISEIFQLNRDRSSLILRAVRGEYEKAPVSLTKLITLSLEKFSFLAEKQNIQLNRNIHTSTTTVQGNESDLIRVFDNLLTNALRYTPANGNITVRTSEKEGFFEVEITDDGAGIAEENLNKIWESGWQGAEKKGAAGLGLSIVKQIIEMHQGTIVVTSPALGKGTTFQIKLPFQDLITT